MSRSLFLTLAMAINCSGLSESKNSCTAGFQFSSCFVFTSRNAKSSSVDSVASFRFVSAYGSVGNSDSDLAPGAPTSGQGWSNDRWPLSYSPSVSQRGCPVNRVFIP